MSEKRLQITLTGDHSELIAANKKLLDSFANLERVAERAGKAIDRMGGHGSASGGNGAAATTAALEKVSASRINIAEREKARLQAIEDRFVAKEYQRETERIKRAERMAEKAIAAKEKEAERIQAIEDRWLARDYRASVQAEKRKLEETEKAAAAKAKLQAREEAAILRNRDLTGAFVSKIVQVGAAYLGLNSAVSLMKELGDATKQAAEFQKRQADEFIRYRNAQREGLGMRDRPANTAEALKEAQFAVKTGLGLSEGTEFSKAFSGSAAQYEEGFGKEEFERYRQQTGALAATSGIDPRTLGDFAGTILGSQDFKGRFGARAPEAATAEFYRSLKILQHGRGENAQLAQQFTETAASMLSDQENAGLFKTPHDLASMVSILAQNNPGESATMLRQASMNLREFNVETPEGQFLASAGVTPDMDMRATLEKIAPVIKAEAAATPGMKIQDVVRSHFTDRGAARGISTLLMEGVMKGGFEERDKYGEQFAAPEAAQAEITRSRADVNGAVPARIAEAKAQLDRLTRGARTAGYESLQEEVVGKMQKGGRLDSTSANAGMIWENATLGPSTWAGWSPDARQRRVWSEMASSMQERASAAGQEVNPGFMKWVQDPTGTTEGGMGRFRAEIDRLNKLGVNVLPGQGEGESPDFMKAPPGPEAAAKDIGAGLTHAGANGWKRLSEEDVAAAIAGGYSPDQVKVGMIGEFDREGNSLATPLENTEGGERNARLMGQRGGDNKEVVAVLERIYGVLEKPNGVGVAGALPVPLGPAPGVAGRV